MEMSLQNNSRRYNGDLDYRVAFVWVNSSKVLGKLARFGWKVTEGTPLRPWPTLESFVRNEDEFFIDGWCLTLCGFYVELAKWWTLG